MYISRSVPSPAAVLCVMVSAPVSHRLQSLNVEEACLLETKHYIVVSSFCTQISIYIY